MGTLWFRLVGALSVAIGVAVGLLIAAAPTGPRIRGRNRHSAAARGVR